MVKFTVDGAVIALVDDPIWIRVQKNGCYGRCDFRKAEGVAINSTPYNLPGHDIGGVATVSFEKVENGTYLLRQDANIDYLSMMTGIDLPVDTDRMPPIADDEMEVPE